MKARILVILLLPLCAACVSPTLSTGLSIGPNGLSIQPAISANVGGVGVTVAQ